MLNNWEFGLVIGTVCFTISFIISPWMKSLTQVKFWRVYPPGWATASRATRAWRAPGWAARPSSARRQSPLSRRGSRATRLGTTSKVSEIHFVTPFQREVLIMDSFGLFSDLGKRRTLNQKSCIIFTSKLFLLCLSQGEIYPWWIYLLDLSLLYSILYISANGTVAHYGALSDDALSLSVRLSSLTSCQPM